MSYINYCCDNQYRGPLAEKPLAVAAHGGQGEEAVDYYYKSLAVPVAGALAGVGMRPVGSSESMPNGAAFGIRSLTMPVEGIFCTIEHDWDSVRACLAPLVENLISAVPISSN